MYVYYFNLYKKNCKQNVCNPYIFPNNNNSPTYYADETHSLRILELLSRIELPTSSLPRKCSTTELQQLIISGLKNNSQSAKLISYNLLLRAGDEARTRDLQLGRLSLYQLSYSRRKYLLFKKCGQGRIRTSVHLREQIYSLPPLTTRPPTHFRFSFLNAKFRIKLEI